MEKYSIKKQSKLLRVLINLCDQREDRILFMSDDAEKIVSECSFVSHNELCTIINILKSKQLIESIPSPYSEELYAYNIKITPKGYDFHPQEEYINIRRWKDRIWGFITGSLFTAAVGLITAMISA